MITFLIKQKAVYRFVRSQNVNRNKAESFEVCIWTRHWLQGIVRNLQWSRWTMVSRRARGTRDRAPEMKHDYICHSEDKIFLFPDGFGTLWARLTRNIKLRSISCSISLAGMMAGRRMSLCSIAPGHHGLTIHVTTEDEILQPCDPQPLWSADPFVECSG